jgi:quinol monooxygenase YgiN
LACGSSAQKSIDQEMKLMDGTEVISAARISVRPEKRRELFLTISSLLDPIRNEQGCRGFRFYGEAGEQDAFLLIGEWETEGDLDRHLHSEHFAVLRGSIELLGKESALNLKIMSLVGGLDAFSRKVSG